MIELVDGRVRRRRHEIVHFRAHQRVHCDAALLRLGGQHPLLDEMVECGLQSGLPIALQIHLELGALLFETVQVRLSQRLDLVLGNRFAVHDGCFLRLRLSERKLRNEEAADNDAALHKYASQAVTPSESKTPLSR